MSNKKRPASPGPPRNVRPKLEALLDAGGPDTGGSNTVVNPPEWFQGKVYSVRSILFFKATGKKQAPQQAAIEFGRDCGHTFFLAQQLSEQDYAYASCKDGDVFLDWYGIYQGNKHFYEMLVEGKPACLCMDVEKYQVQRNDAEAKALLDGVVRLVLLALEKVNVYPEPGSFVITTGSREAKDGYKISYHICNPTVVFKNFEVEETAFFHTHVQPLVKQQMDNSPLWRDNNAKPVADIVDSSIYTKNRQMRMVDSSKFGSNQPFLLLQGSARDSLASAPQHPVNVVLPETIAKTSAATTGTVKRSRRTLLHSSSQAVDTPSIHYSQVLALLRKIDPNSTLIENLPGRKYDVKTIGSRTCPAGETHDHQNGHFNITDDGSVWYNCYKSGKAKKCAGKGSLIGKLDIDDFVDASTEPTLTKQPVHHQQIVDDANQDLNANADRTSTEPNVPPPVKNQRIGQDINANDTDPTSPESNVPVQNQSIGPDEDLIGDTNNIVQDFDTSGLDFSGLAKVVTYSEEFVRPLRFKTKTLAVKAHMGSGKSRAVNNLMKEIRQMQPLLDNRETLLSSDTKRIIVVSPRISFSKAIQGEFKQHGFVLYSECDNFYDHPRIIVQYESLYRLVDNTSIQYDLLILDELETILECALSTTTNKNNLITNSRVFEMLVKNAHKVLALDADLSNKGLNMLKAMVGPKNITLHVNTYQRLPRDIRLYEDGLVWQKRLLEKIEAGKRIVICVTSKGFADTHIVPMLIEYNIVHAYYHVDNKDKRDELLNINTEWCKYQVVMFTPCITVGCDFSVQDYFDEIWAMASTNSAVPRQLFQMLWRCRKPKSAKPIMHVYVKDTAFGGKQKNQLPLMAGVVVEPPLGDDILPLTTVDVIEAMRRKTTQRSAIEEDLRAQWQLQLGDDMRLQWVGGDDWLTQVYAHSEVEKNRARKDFVGEVKRLAKEKQCKLVMDTIKLSNSLCKKLTDKREQEKRIYKQQTIEKFDTAELIDEQQARDLERCCDEQSALLRKKYTYCARFNVPVNGQHYWYCDQHLKILYNIQRLQTKDASTQLNAESHTERHVALHETHFECIHMMQQLAQWLDLTSPLDTDTMLTKRAWQDAADRILAAKEKMSSIFDLRFRLTDSTDAWKQARTIVNQVYGSYIMGSFEVEKQSTKGPTRGESIYKLRFKEPKRLKTKFEQTVFEVAQTLVS